jgi:peroxiredoxin Q/BCP
MLPSGTKAPAFTLPDQNGKTVALKDLAGRWVVLYFYPKDDTPGCTVEACEFTAALSEFRGLDAEVFGCSADGASAHTQFIAKHKLGINLLTDADRKVMEAYGAYGKKLMYGKPVVGVIRSTVLISPDGLVAHHWATVKAAGHAEQVREKLAELQGGAPVAAAKPAAKAKKPAPKAKPVVKAKKSAPKAKPVMKDKKAGPKPKVVAKKPAAMKAKVLKAAAKKPMAGKVGKSRA